MSSGTLMDLPFTFDATVMPGPRHTRPRKLTLRADAIVEVANLQMSDFSEVADLVRAPSPNGFPAEEPCTIHERDGRFFSPMTAAGRPVAVDEFTALLREAAATFRIPRGAGRLDRCRYPMRHGRHRRDDNITLDHLTLGDHAIAEGWPAPKVIASNFDAAMGSAVTYLMDAFAVVDGQVWAECSEPVWQVRHYRNHRYRLLYSISPTLMRSYATFRFDQRDRALDYARSRRRRIDPVDQDPAVDCSRPASFTRNDLTETAAATLKGWPELRYWCRIWDGLPAGDATDLLNMFHAEGEVKTYDVPTVMDGIAELANGTGRRLAPRARAHAEINALFEGVGRWYYEKANLDPSVFDPMNDADWQALQDLDM